MSAEDPAAGAPVRALAARTLATVVRDGVPAERALADRTAAAGEGALLAALVYGALRWHHRLEWQVGELLARPLGRGEAELAALLRVGLYQLQWLRTPDHAAVSTAVDAAGLIGRRRAKGLVNAVLRRFLRERAALDERAARHPQAQLSHPSWLIERLRADHGERADAIFAANNTAPPMWLRVNTRLIEPAAYERKLSEAGIALQARPELDPARLDAAAARVPSALLLAEPMPMSELPGFADGLVSVQDAASQLAAVLLAPAPGERVLDACAAPGGKTAHLLEACPEMAELVAVDRDADRLARVGENLERLRLAGPGARLVQADAAAPDTWWDGRPFDRVLLDAPCSAVGVIRRHPDIKVLRRPGDVAKAAALQHELLRRLWPLLRDGGTLLYATCSVLHEENRSQVERFVAETPDAAAAGPGPDGGLQLLPGEGGMDGFYYACIAKRNVLRSARG